MAYEHPGCVTIDSTRSAPMLSTICLGEHAPLRRDMAGRVPRVASRWTARISPRCRRVPAPAASRTCPKGGASYSTSRSQSTFRLGHRGEQLDTALAYEYFPKLKSSATVAPASSPEGSRRCSRSEQGLCPLPRRGHPAQDCRRAPARSASARRQLLGGAHRRRVMLRSDMRGAAAHEVRGRLRLNCGGAGGGVSEDRRSRSAPAYRNAAPRREAASRRRSAPCESRERAGGGMRRDAPC